MSGLNLCFLFFCRQKKVDTRSASADAEDGEILAGRASLAYRTPEAPEKKNNNVRATGTGECRKPVKVRLRRGEEIHNTTRRAA